MYKDNSNNLLLMAEGGVYKFNGKSFDKTFLIKYEHAQLPLLKIANFVVSSFTFRIIFWLQPGLQFPHHLNRSVTHQRDR
jgi:hypothetical protein